MTELKTLKDFTDFTKNIVNRGYKIEYVEKEHLKQEATKWIKNCTHPVDFTRNDRCGHSWEKFPFGYCDVCQRFIEFFNITKEDLE